MNCSDLTDETYAFLVRLYGEYLQRLKDGASIKAAKRFNDDPIGEVDPVISSDPDSDTYIEELRDSEYVIMYITGDFDLTNKAIKLMEARFYKNVASVIDFIKGLKS